MDKLEELRKERRELLADTFEHGTNVDKNLRMREIDEDILVEKFRRILPKQADKGIYQNNK